MKEHARGWCSFDHNDDGRYPSAFNEYCFWGLGVVNSRHQLGAALLDVILLSDNCPALSWETHAGECIMNWFRTFLGLVSGQHEKNAIDFSSLDRKLGCLATLIKLHCPSVAHVLSAYRTGCRDFLPGPYYLREDGLLGCWSYNSDNSSAGISLLDVLRTKDIQPWGCLLDLKSPWPSWPELD